MRRRMTRTRQTQTRKTSHDLCSMVDGDDIEEGFIRFMGCPPEALKLYSEQMGL